MSRRPHLTSRLQGFDHTIFSVMSALALEHDAVNLGQGFPDDDGPDEVLEAAVDAMRRGHNQYAPGAGVAPLRRAVVEHQKRFYRLDHDPEQEVVVTAGATEAIAAAILGLCETGDEVVVFEPYYDSYAATVSMAGAVRVPVTLRAPDYHYDPAQLERAVSPRTRLILLNTPHNPTGKVFSQAELEHVAAVAVEHDLLVVTDEVYEHLVYDGEHVPIATLPGMAERTVTISSGGKTFSFTGWKVGWACAPPDLARAVLAAKQWLSFSSNPAGQLGIATALGLGDDYYDELVASYRRRRDQLVAGLRDVGFTVTAPAGTYFATVDVRDVGEGDGLAFCRRIPAELGVAAVPNVVFYDDVVEGGPLVRFAFCKRPATIDEGIARLHQLSAR